LSSLPDEDTFTGFLEASLSVMQRECVQAYQLLCTQLATRRVQIEVDGEVVTLVFEPHHVAMLPASTARPTITLKLRRQAILDLTDGKFTLQEAILEGIVTLHGDLKDLVLFHEGWLTYMRGMVRCPSIPDLLERYRYASAASGGA
jgi:hypothetical protein